MILKVNIDNYPACPFQTRDGHGFTVCNHDDVMGHCSEKAPEDCPLRKNYVVVAALGEFERLD